MRRREFLSTVAAGAVAPALLSQNPPRKGKFKQGVMSVNFDPKLSMEERCQIAQRVGFQGYDNVPNRDWPILKKYGLVCSMGSMIGPTFEDGLIRPARHEEFAKAMIGQIDAIAAAGYDKMITVGGQRRGMSDEEGWENATALLKRVTPRAEDKGVTIVIEVMNSKYKDAAIGRFDQICDHIAWAAELCKRVNSPRFRVLYDVYHAQIMDGNIVENIRNHYQWIAHFHTGGVPGRHEIDGSQELNYRYIAGVLAELGFDGFVTHEYRLTPGKDTETELKKAFDIMNV